MKAILELFVDPRTELQLELSHDSTFLTTPGSIYGYSFQEGVIDFSLAITFDSIGVDVAAETESDTSPELKAFHDEEFKKSGKDIYDFDSLPAITKSGHFRRMALLERIELGSLEGKVAVDFGTGPWGFACIYPKLQQASACIGFDISAVALAQARETTAEELTERVVYATSDGDAIPLRDSTVDIFFGGEVVEHVRKPEVFLQHIARVCKDGATVILTTPNRDALNYLVHKLPYAAGHEHIALMNYGEFVEKLDIFFDIKEVVGYDTTIGPLLDTTLEDSKILDLIQRRAENFPELASGMIAVATVNKQKYHTNKKNLTRREYLWSHPSFQIRGDSQVQNLFGEVNGVNLSPGTSITCSVFAEEISLLFWGHAWSGFVKIFHDHKQIAEIDLFLLNGGFVRIDLHLEYPFGDLAVLSAGDKRAASNGPWVIFYKALGYVPQAEEKNTSGLRSPLLAKYSLHQHILATSM